MIALVGGPTDHADIESVRLIRTSGEVAVVNLYNVLNAERGGEEPAVVLWPGDLVIVPRKPLN